MFKRILLTILAGCISPCAYATAAGTSGAQFLKLVASPRAAALGSAFTAFSDDVNSIVFNPSGLAFLAKKEAALVQNNWIQDISNQYLAFAVPTSAGTFGLNVTMVSIKDIVKRDNSGVDNGQYNASDMAVSLAYAKKIGEKFALGLNVKSINQTIDTEKANGIAGDFGLLYKASSKVDIGVSVLNVGSGIKFINEADPLPTTVKGGAVYMPSSPLKIGVDVSKANDSDATFGAGAEYLIKAGKKLVFPLRIGYRSGYETEQLSGLSGGCGVLYNDTMGFDFAWAPMGILGDSMKFGLTYKF
jgi:hypothetical protein